MRDGTVPSGLINQSCIEIARIYSAQHAIGKGVGKRLMQTCHEIANQKNKSILWLGVWEKNQRAIDFYAKWGFEKFGEQNFVLGNDVQRDWLMKKSL
jgi:ribosomal protein S18 acetylase RimI-like enzyme